MEFNNLIFPAPTPSYDENSFPNELLWIPRVIGKGENIPVLYLPYFRGSSKLLLYFHGNAEDLGLSYELADHLRTSLEMHVMSVEYPGYGAYVGTPSADALINDIENLFSYITTNL